MFLFEPVVLPAVGSFVLSSSYIRARTIFLYISFCVLVFFLAYISSPLVRPAFFLRLISLMVRFQLLRMPVSFRVSYIHNPNNPFKAEYLRFSLALSLFEIRLRCHSHSLCLQYYSYPPRHSVILHIFLAVSSPRPSLCVSSL